MEDSNVTATMDAWTVANENCTNCSNFTESIDPPKAFVWTIINCVIWSLICVAGLVGNGMVIFVVLTYAKMKTVTNMYILNLAIADLCFLVGLPFLIVTAIMERWIFGYVMCKIFYIQTSINWFTSVFTLTVMSADRYLAVCHPVSSMRYRAPIVSRLVCVVVWTASLLVMLPIMIYATLVDHPEDEGHSSCTLVWPEAEAIAGDIAFIWYAFLLGFAIPVSLISVFYILVLVRLQSVGPVRKSKEMKKSHRKVTKMVLAVITVYVVCWLPYWIFQIVLQFVPGNMPWWTRDLFQIITVMSYTNSMLNPLLYAFLSDNFRKSFIKAFHCASRDEVNHALQHEQSIFPGNRAKKGKGKLVRTASGENLMSNPTTVTTSTNATKLETTEFPVTSNHDSPAATPINHDSSAATPINLTNHTDNGKTPVTEV